MKKRFKLGLVGLAAGVVGVSGMTALGNYLYDMVILRREREVDPEGLLEPWRRWLAEHPDRRDVTIPAVDSLLLHGHVIPSKDPNCHRWAVCIHGYSDRSSSTAHFAQHYVEKGWNVLLPDLRGHGESEGDYVGFGWDDRLDIVAWCAWITRRDAQAQIILHGVSMGAATALITTGGPLTSQVKGVVSDCAYTTAMDVIRHIYHTIPQRYGPASAALSVLRNAVLRRARYDLKKADALAAVRRSHTPTLFIHGVADDFVPASMMAELYEQARCPKEFLWVPKAGHGRAIQLDPVLYWSTVDDWLERLLDAA